MCSTTSSSTSAKHRTERLLRGGQPKGLLDYIIRTSGYCIRPIYYILWVIRYWLYRIGVKKQQRPDKSIHIISIGNITLGGSGKTPLVIRLAREAEHRGHKVGVLLRGYGRNITQPIVVRDDQNILVNAAKVGDEAMLLAKSLNKVCVIACAKRLLAAELAASPPYNCDVLILDDGFQHWQLGRDVDIMVLDSELPENGWRLFPLGYLREPLSALRRADVFVSDEKGKNELLQRFNKMSVRHLVSDNQVFCTNREIKGLSNILSKVTLSRDDLVRIDWPVFWFAGIARPERIEASLNELGANKKRRMGLPLEDHYEYTRDNLEDIFQQYAKWRETLTEEQQANGRLVCTEKDAVKIELLLKRNDPQIEYIVMDVSIAEMDRFLNTVLPNKDK